MKKILFIILILFSCLGTSFAQKCLEEGRKLFDSKDYVAAEHTLEKCSAKEKQLINYQISMGGIKILLAKYNEANKYFNNALKNMPAKSPYYAYVYSNLGDIAMINKQVPQALKYYKNALKYQPENVNALVGYGLTLEKTGKKDLAIENYKKALDIDFSNLPARKYLIRLEPDSLTEQEKLETLKERNILAPEAMTFEKEDIELLKKILKAERAKGIDYLSLRFGSALPDGSIFEKNANTFYARKMLTLSGYNLLIDKLSEEAKELFLSQKVLASDLFSLTDFSGKPVFNDKGLLTEEGLTVYNKSLNNKKAYLLPGEKAPVDNTKIDSLVQEYLAQGYSEVSRLEFQYVQDETLCSEKTLVNNLRCRTIGEDKDKRYFVLSRGDTTIPYSIPFMFVEKYRETHSRDDEDGAPVYRDTFGEKQRDIGSLCDKNGNMLGML
ncbi:MAG: tetratricopeptide repeat protein [Elusimicrobiaceae bacterium]|nr:tetratricopeptide repeat protein [Elusimicrobiaceae bacterium]